MVADHTAQSRYPAFLHTALVVAAALCALLANAAARAQPLPLIPNAITSADLGQYAERLGLSRAQMQSMLGIHDAYKQRHRQFVETDVRKLQDALLDVAGRFRPNAFSIPPRRELEALLEQYKRELARAQALDRSFFSDLQSILAEDQMPRVERLRLQREVFTFRDTVRGFSRGFNPAAAVNLAEMTQRLDCTPEQAQQIDLVLMEYEAALLARTRRFYSVIVESMKVMLDLIDQLGLRDMTIEQLMALERNQNVVGTVQATFDESSKPFQAAASDLSQLNWRTFKRIVLLLDADKAQEFRDRYFQRAYGEGYGGLGRWRPRFAKALKLDGVHDEQRAALQSQLDDLARQDDALLDSLAPAIESIREYRTFQQFTQRRADSARERLDDLRQRRTALAERAETALGDILGPQLLALLDPKNENQAKPPQAVVAAAASVASAKTPGAPATGQSRMSPQSPPAPAGRPAQPEPVFDPKLPAPLGIADLTLLADMLAWSADQRSLLQTLYEDYRGEFDQGRQVAAPIAPETSAGGAGESERAADDAPLPVKPPSLPDRIDALAKIDDTFMDHLGTLAGAGDDQRMLRLLARVRQRELGSHLARKLYVGGGEEDSWIDLSALALRSGMTPAEFSSIDQLLNEYTELSAPSLATLSSAAQEVQRRRDSLAALEQQGQKNQAGAEFLKKKLQEASRDGSAAAAQLRDLNRQTLPRLLAALSSQRAALVRDAYQRAAYPDVYRDWEVADKVIEASLALADLQMVQRQQIQEAAAQYRHEYAQLSDRLVTLRSQRREDWEDMPPRADIEREIEMERLRSDRRELSARTRLLVELALTPEQARGIPELNRSVWGISAVRR